MTTSAPSTTSRRTVLSALLLAPLAGAALSACGSSGPGTSSDASGSGSAGTASVWYLSGDPDQKRRQDNVDAWNKANPDKKLDVTFFQNDAYKAKIQTAIGAGQAPTLIYGWGGGALKSYVQADQVVDLTDWLSSNADVKSSVLASTFDAATIDGKIYAVPVDAAQPVVLYYNKDVFAKVGAQPPTTWDEALALVETFQKAGVAAFSLAGQSNWTSMMWLEYFYDRISGSQVFADIYAGKADAWSSEGSIEALQAAQDLVKAGGFVKGFESVTADSNADQALLMTGKAAMLLQGAWCYGGMKATDASFVSDKLGYIAFPAVTGGKGDPSAVAGNPANYLSISASASAAQQETAKAYLAVGANSKDYAQAVIDTGGVSVASDGQQLASSSEDADWLGFCYELVGGAANFVQSWDQALSPSTAATLLTSISQLFTQQVTPEQFAQTMNATLGK